jgi:hypothetical protein
MAVYFEDGKEPSGSVIGRELTERLLVYKEKRCSMEMVKQ